MEIHKPTGNWSIGLLLSLITVVLWGTVPIALGIVLTDLDSSTVNWFRFFSSFVILTIVLARQKQLPKISTIIALPIPLLLLAIGGLAINYLGFANGLAYTSPAHAEVLIQLAGVFFGLGGLVIFKEKYRRSQWIGLGILTIGFSLFFNEQFKQILTNNTQQYLWGSGLLIIGAIAWSIYALAQKQLLKMLTSSQIMWLIYGSCSVIFLLFANPINIGILNQLQLFMLIFCGLNTIVGYGCFAESLVHWEASKVSAIIALAPIVTLVSNELINYYTPGLIKPEYITNLGLFGALLVVGGAILIALGKK